ncbi:sulfatase-like hydrolase/transferase [Shewanella corallii]|uniref:Sulfatase-like hydrolase/transferase n=1 Tax=Shewanella corallii TaxID=560080 RepID=A0ABT0N6G7_9GAMM|nr:sulfatase-like hydrolase/transferase [Shewanella corallii]MCL2913705.1 sulfatase-like hydrolase/transferase [Shewanella corallii]
MKSLLLTSIFGLLTISQAVAEPARKDNLLFVMTDEMKWDVMGVAGHPVVKTPNLDRLAAEGTYYQTAYTVAPICSPSRRSFFTSRYPHVHGVTDNSKRALANDGEVDLPTLLKYQGYETAISGKLHFYPEWHDWSFDHFWSRSSEGPNKLQNYRQYMQAKYGADAFAPKPGSVLFPDDPLGHDLGEYQFAKEDFETFWLTDRALEFLDGRSEEKPFFLFLSFNEPHSPYRATQPYASMYDPDKLDVPELPEGVRAERQQAIAKGVKGKSRHLIDDEQMMRELTAQYFGHITNVDDNLGRVLSYLDSSGLADNTIVVFSADHGNMLGDHGKWFKGVMYEGSSRVPLIIRAGKSTRYARVMNQGKVVEQVVESIDVMPTLLEMMAIELPSGMQGQSLLPLTSGKTDSWKNHAFSQRTDYMFRQDHFKLIVPGKPGRGELELYDLSADPGEHNNLANKPEYQQKVAQMRAAVVAWQEDKPAPIQVSGLAAPDHLFNSEALRQAHSKSIKAMMAKHPKCFNNLCEKAPEAGEKQ